MVRRPFAATLLVLAAGAVLVPVAGVLGQATPEGNGTPPAQATPAEGIELTPVVWQLTAIEAADGSTQTPDDPASYTIQFLPDGAFAIRADCNRGRGTFEVDGDRLTIDEAIAVTRAACPPGSLDTVYLERLPQVATFAYEDDALVLSLADGGALRFTPALTGVLWRWRAFEGGDGTVVAPDDPSRYTVQFLDDGTVAVQADCNGGGGSYTADVGQIDISGLFTTLIACPEGSLDTEFLRYLDEAVSYTFRAGKLYLALPADAGIAEFAPAVIEEAAATPTAG